MMELARWLPNDTPALNRAIVVRAMQDLGICEQPLGSNRSGVIDGYNASAGVPAGSYWCASAVSAWWRESGAELPPGPASCDNWMMWGKHTGRWNVKPVAGCAVLYGVPGDASHIGVVVREAPILLSCEGNTSLGGEFSRNGVAVAMKPVNSGRVLGYVWPTPGG